MEKEAASISSLPYSVFRAVCDCLQNDAHCLKKLMKLVAFDEKSTKNFRSISKAENLLYELTNRGTTIQGLLKLLNKVRLENAQLLLRRKFKKVEIVEQVNEAANIPCGSTIIVRCRAIGFPYPRYQWFENEKKMENKTQSFLEIKACCSNKSTYFCIVWNIVPEDPLWLKFYLQYSPLKSEAKSKIFSLNVSCQRFKEHDKSEPCNNNCQCCRSLAGVDQEEALIDNNNNKETVSKSNSLSATLLQTAKRNVKQISEIIDRRTLIATDKIALIIGNANYRFLPKLTTPIFDAQCLAKSLLECDFKTVTLRDLTLHEMRRMIKAYCSMLGEGVYALFYFVGHGFEAAGQCYLLSVDAPSQNYASEQDCLCAEEVLATMQEANPALNVILLDVCRRFPDLTDSAILNPKIFKPKVNRNTVFGYATSFGEGAYEVKGEMNGIFMKYFRKRIEEDTSITEILNLTMRDLENDPKACQVQFPEIRTNLTQPRGLKDETDCAGHTRTFDCRTLLWQELHELPNPVKHRIDNQNLLAIIWFDFSGHFVNTVHVYATLYSIMDKQDQHFPDSCEILQDTRARKFLAFLNFPELVETTETVLFEEQDGEDARLSTRVILKNLQQYETDIVCNLEIRNRETNFLVEEARNINLGLILATKLKHIIPNYEDGTNCSKNLQF